MTQALLLYNQPQLAADHPDAEAEHTVLDVARAIEAVLLKHGLRPHCFGLGQDPRDLWRELEARRPDVVVNLFEGNPDNTETESYVAGLLEWKGIPFTGSPMRALTVCRAKHLAKRLLQGEGLPTPAAFVVDNLPLPETRLEWPVIAKLACQDASVGIHQASVCTNLVQLEARVRYLLEHYGPPVLVEEYVPGREFNMALMELPELRSLPPSEIMFPPERPGYWPILTYDGKWKPGEEEYDTTLPKCPADLPSDLAKQLDELACKAYRLMGCRDYARVDFRVRGDRPYILEVNPNPDIGSDAGFANCARAAGVPYDEFLVRLVEQARRRRPAAVDEDLPCPPPCHPSR